MNEEQLLELYQKFERLKNCTKKAEKTECLEDYQYDELFVYVLEFLVNTHKKTGISDAKLKKDLSDKEAEEFSCLKQLIEYILANPTGKDAIVRSAQLFIESLSNSELQTFIANIVTKKYKCGVAAKQVAAILPSLVKLDHQVMLANKFKGELKESVQISLKLDGTRNTAIINKDGTIQHLSRQGKEIRGLRQINSVLSNMMLEGYVLDGELIRINHDDLPSEENFKETISIVNSKDPNKKGLEFVVFDIIPLDDYINQSCTMPYSERKKLMIGKIGIGNQFVRLVPMYGVTDNIDVVYEKLQFVTNLNQEGLMLNTLTGLYKFGKRSNDLLKVKKFDTCDIKCIGLEEGDGKYKGTLGKLVCDYKGFELRVGSGLTDEERDYFWANQDKIVNHLVEIKYFEESSDKEGNLSVRFPVFVRVRDDKEDESYE